MPSPWELEVSELLSENVMFERHDLQHKPASVPNASKCPSALTHPLHTYRVDTLCMPCHLAKEQRIARFETNALKLEVDRECLRKQRQNKAQQQLRRAVDTLRAESKDIWGSRQLKPLRLTISADMIDESVGRKTFNLGKMKGSVMSWTSPVVAVTSSKRPVQRPSELQTTGAATRSGSAARQSWLNSPKLRRPLSLGVAPHRNSQAQGSHGEETLSPEHFGVPVLLHDSQESLMTDEFSSRKGSKGES